MQQRSPKQNRYIAHRNTATSDKRDSGIYHSADSKAWSDKKGKTARKSSGFPSETFQFQVQTSNGIWYAFPRKAGIKMSEAYKKGKIKTKFTLLVGQDLHQENHEINLLRMTQTCSANNKYGKERTIRLAIDEMLNAQWGYKYSPVTQAFVVGEDEENSSDNPAAYYPTLPPYKAIHAKMSNEETLTSVFEQEKKNVTRAKRFKDCLNTAYHIKASQALKKNIENVMHSVELLERAYTECDPATLQRVTHDCKAMHLGGPLIKNAPIRAKEQKTIEQRRNHYEQWMKHANIDLSSSSVAELKALKQELMETEVKSFTSPLNQGNGDGDCWLAYLTSVEKALKDKSGGSVTASVGRGGFHPRKKTTASQNSDQQWSKNNASLNQTAPASYFHQRKEQHVEAETNDHSSIFSKGKKAMKSFVSMRFLKSSTEDDSAHNYRQYLNEDVSIDAINPKSKLHNVFVGVLVTDKPDQLNKGRDVKEKGEYDRLELAGVWRIENASNWEQYNHERKRIREELTFNNVKAPHFYMRKALFDALQELPGINDLYAECNETYLLHGTRAENVVPMMIDGINPPPWESNSLFGNGIYFAEDSCKNDQYGVGDANYGDYPDLHRFLYAPSSDYPFPRAPYKAYYMFLCRVIVGYAVQVTCTDSAKRSMINNFHDGHPIFRDEKERELATIPETNMRYHCLVAKKGGAIVRFREFCQYHGNRVYPEYLMCYSRM